MYTHIYTYTYVCIYIYIHIHTHTYIHTYMHTYIHTYIYIYIYTCIHTICNSIVLCMCVVKYISWSVLVCVLLCFPGPVASWGTERERSFTRYICLLHIIYKHMNWYWTGRETRAWTLKLWAFECMGPDSEDYEPSSAYRIEVERRVHTATCIDMCGSACCKHTINNG